VLSPLLGSDCSQISPLSCPNMLEKLQLLCPVLLPAWARALPFGHSERTEGAYSLLPMSRISQPII
jgi:hypothetical protein